MLEEQGLMLWRIFIEPQKEIAIIKHFRVLGQQTADLLDGGIAP
jgi:hypothetical protein